MNNLSKDELNKILKEEYEKNKNLKKERSIQNKKKLQKQNETLAQVKSIGLFLFSEDENQHYSLIKNFSRLARSQITSDRRKIHIFKKCLTHFSKKYLFKRHLKYCNKNETVAVKMPTKNSVLKFQNHFKKLPVPFTIYADFECFTLPMNSCQPNPNKSFTQGYQKHEPSGYCLYIKALDGMKASFKPLVYKKETSDEDISKRFIKHVVKLTHKIYQDYYKNPKT